MTLPARKEGIIPGAANLADDSLCWRRVGASGDLDGPAASIATRRKAA